MSLLLRQTRRAQWFLHGFKLAPEKKKSAKKEAKTVWNHEMKLAVRQNPDGSEDTTPKLVAPEGADDDSNVHAVFQDGTSMVTVT